MSRASFLAEQRRVAAEHQLQRDVDQLRDNFARMPDSMSTTMPTKTYRALLLSTDGWMMARGYSYDIVGKSLGAGVYRVSLRRRGDSPGMK